MIIDTPEAAIAEVRRQALPAVFVDILEGSTPHLLKYDCQTPRHYYRECHALTALVPRLDGLCPLYEFNGEAIVGVIGGREFVRFYYEDTGIARNDDEVVEVLGHNYQQFVTALLLELEEAGLTEKFDEVALLLGYTHTGALREILDGYDEATGERKLEAFKASVS